MLAVFTSFVICILLNKINIISLKIHENRYKQKILTYPYFVCYRYAVRIHYKILDIICNSKDYVRVTQSQMLGYIGSVYRYLPSHMKNGIVILVCIFESIIPVNIPVLNLVYSIIRSLPVAAWYAM